MTRKIVFSLRLLLFAAIVSMLASPIVDVHAVPPMITSMSITSTARHEGKSLYKAARQELHQDWQVMRTLYPNESNKSHADYDQGKLVTMTETETSREPADLLVAPGYSNPSEGLLVRYYGLGETITFSIVFDQNVIVTGGSPTLRFEMDGYNGGVGTEYEARYASGSGTDTLTFNYVVQAGDDVFGEIGIWAGLEHNTDDLITNASNEPFIDTPNIREILAQGLGFNHIPDPHGRRNGANLIGVPKKYPDPGLKHLVDTLSAHVRITGLIKSTTHTPEGYLGNLSTDLTGYRGTTDPSPDMSLYVDFSETPPMEAVTEPSTQTEAFDVEIRFFHYAGGDGDSVAADDPQGFEPADISITGTGVNREDWDVELALIGLDHRDPGFAPSKNDKGQIKHTPAFIVYKATITPPNGFDGEVEIQLDEGATADIVGNPSYASNTFTVPVRTPPTVQVARPEGETGLVTEGFTVEFTFSRNVVSPFDAEKISITQADGTALEWDVTVTQPTSPSATVSAVITPALNFSGEVRITLEAGAVRDAVAGSEQVNVAAGERLTVTVDTSPPQVIEAPKIVARPPGEAYTGDDELTVEVPFDEAGVSYEGDNPPYVVLYLGERVLANARHATWKKGAERAGSTIVPFVYPIRVGDVATSLSIDERGVLIPTGTRVVDGDGNQLLGQAPPAVAPTEPVTQLPAATGTDERLPFPPTMEEAALTFDISETPVVTYVPILEPTEEPRSPASDVPRSPIVFNELGNGSGDTNDWLEFRNVTGAAVSLKEWELSVVQDGKKEDTSLIVFPDVSVPANGLLLLTNSDPTAEGNVLAGGDNVATSKVEQKGSPHRYLVADGLSLPDDGQFLLILRKAKEKLGLDEAFVDVAGGGGSDTDAFIREQTGLYETYVWPLQVLQAPDGDTAAALSSGKVWQRADADKVGYHKDAWAEAAFTGLGYDRKVSASAATAGTPGYPNGAVKTAAATPKGSITFSEYMVDSGGGTLPQWIELYNRSKTDAINLNRWKLEIQNVDSEDLVGRPIVTLTLQEKLIQPNQTLLIVAGTARASSGTSLPAGRIYNLLALHEKNLRIKKPQDTFLSEEGFYLKLTDANGHLVDEIGNTDGNRRTTDAPKWVLRQSDVEGSRSSLVRRYEKGGIAEEGTRAASWVLASNVAKIAASALHYGHADDIGTPGHRRGGALPVELSSFSVKRHEAGAVVVAWATESEVDNAGFNLRRSEKRESGFTLLNAALIAGAGTTGERQTYTFTDTSANPGVEYYYQIEEVSFDGKRETLATRRLRGPVSAANRMLTTFGAVKQREE